jgi:hypothetical protein
MVWRWKLFWECLFFIYFFFSLFPFLFICMCARTCAGLLHTSIRVYIKRETYFWVSVVDELMLGFVHGMLFQNVGKPASVSLRVNTYQLFKQLLKIELIHCDLLTLKFRTSCFTLRSITILHLADVICNMSYAISIYSCMFFHVLKCHLGYTHWNRCFCMIPIWKVGV